MKIFVTVGTGRYDQLIRVADRLTHLPCTLQIGHGTYVPRHHPYFRFKDDLTEDYNAHPMIVSHGGAVTLLEIVRAGKRVVAVPNLHRTDRHQLEIVDQLASDGHLLCCRDLDFLEEYIERARTFDFERYEPPPCTIGEEILKVFGSESDT